ncbi:MAG TPA: hypothetical protein VFE48_25435 [Methylomirabilota bacterium]|nr:hypothetical protein [Methylomirabilota bacterium]
MPTLLDEALAMIRGGTPQRPTHAHLRALYQASQDDVARQLDAQIAPLVRAATRVAETMTVHEIGCACPLCELLLAIKQLQGGAA